MTTRLVSIEITGFRGFNETQAIRLDADAVVLVGSNGSGKTSFVEAIDWLLTGRLERLEDARRHRNEDVISNLYAGSRPAVVRLVLVADGSAIVATREGTSRENRLEVKAGGSNFVGALAEEKLATAFGLNGAAFMGDAADRAILQQERLRKVIASSGEDLHGRLKGLLGLSVLDEFESASRELLSQRTQELRELMQQRDILRSELERSRELANALGSSLLGDAAVSEFRRQLDEQLQVESAWVHISGDVTDQSIAGMLGLLRDLYQRAQRAMLSVNDLTERLAERSDETDALRAIRAELVQYEQEAEVSRARLRQLMDQQLNAEQMATARSTLARVALTLLGDECPVCGQAIDREEVSARLGSLADEVSRQGQLVSDEVQAVRAQIEALDEHIAALRKDEVRKVEAVSLRQQLEAQLSQVWADIEVGCPGDIALPGLSEHSPDRLLPTLTAIANVGRALAALAGALRQPAIQAELEQARNRVADLDGRMVALVREIEQASVREAEGKAFYKATREGSLQVLSDSMERINPIFAEVYRRLAPHPTFTDLDLDHEMYNAKPRAWTVVVDPIEHLRANPNVVCSVGQLNVVGLSYFMAFALSADGGLPFLVLDDPLQAMDDVNALGLSDVCRRLRTERQLLITTHDERLGRLLGRKLAPRTAGESLIRINFGAWGRSGPEMKTDHQECNADHELLLGAI